MTFIDLSRFDRVGIDTETTGLSFKDRPVGLSIATPDGQKAYYAWGHESGGNTHDIRDVRDWLERVQRDNPQLVFVMHNAPFDMRMLAYVGIKITNRVEDTNIVAALLNELEPSFSLNALGNKYVGQGKSEDALNEWCATHYGGPATRKAQAKNYWRAHVSVVAPYAEDDAALTLALYDTLYPNIVRDDLTKIYDIETALLPILLKMHLVGVRVDTEKARRQKVEFAQRYETAHKTWVDTYGDVNANSTQQLAQLFSRLKLPFETTEAGNPSIDKDFLKTVTHPVAKQIIELRTLKHYAGTFIDNYILDNVDDEGVIHGEFHALRNDRYGTISGRFSSGGALNLQNVPARDGELAPLIRGLFVPYYEDQRWVKFDYSQIEYRYLAHYAGGQLREAYRRDPTQDFHEMVAAMVGIERTPAKTINFGIVYGMGAKKLAASLNRPLDEAQAILELYHGRLPEVRTIYERANRRANTRGWIRTWGQRLRRYAPDPMRPGSHLKAHTGLNGLLQGSAADLIKYAMVRIGPLLDWSDSLLHLTVHDELDLSITPGDAGVRKVKEITEAMEDWDLTVPVRADCEVGDDWGHLTEVDARTLTSLV